MDINASRYRSIFSGQEIDQAIASMQGSLSSLLIANDFNGGTGKIASAELAKTLKLRLDQLNDPLFLTTLLQSNVNFKVFSPSDRIKLDYVIPSFRGIFTDATSRSANSAENITYKGNELTLLLDDGSGNSIATFSRWDIPTSSWKSVPLVIDNDFEPLSVATISANTIFSFRKDRYNAMKCMISVCNIAQTQRQVQEILVAVIGADTYISVYGELGNTTLFTASSTIVGNSVNLVISTLAANLIISGTRITML